MIEAYSSGAQPIEFTLPNNASYRADLTFNEIPEHLVVNSTSFISTAADVMFYNTATKQTSVYVENEQFGNRTTNTSDIEAYIGNNLLSQAIWLAMDSKMVNFTIKQESLPSSLPIKLNTDSLRILLPGIEKKYGLGAEAFLIVKGSNNYSKLEIRQGKLATTASVELEIYVELKGVEGKKYDLATTLNTTLFASVVANSVNKTSYLVNIINAEIIDIDVETSTFKVDGKKLTSLLNIALEAFIPTINSKLGKGINNPAVGVFSVDYMDVYMENNYLNTSIAFMKTQFRQPPAVESLIPTMDQQVLEIIG